MRLGLGRTVLVLAMALVGAFGCVKARTGPKTYNPLYDPRDDVRELLETAYEALEKREVEKLTELLAPDAMVFGLGPSDTLNFRDTAIDSVRQSYVTLGPSEFRIRPGRVPVGLAVGARSAWLWDFPRVDVGATTYLPRVTAHAIVDDAGRWRFDALHVSLGVPDDKLYAADAPKKFVVPSEVTTERVKENAEPLVDLTRRILEDLALKVERTGSGADVVLLGTDPGEIFEGGQSFKDLVKPRLAELKKAVFEYQVQGPMRARVADDGRTGWVAANIVLRVGAGKKSQTLPAFRTLWVYEREGAEWHLVLEHQSLALRDEQREGASGEQLKVREARERRDPPLAPKVREAADGGFGTFE